MHLRLLATTLLLLSSAACSASSGKATPCGAPGQWLAPVVTGSGAAFVAAENPVALLERMATQQAVLLGEAHDSAEDHRWQLQVLAQLHARRPVSALGLEMFPRRLQAVLDQWVAGSLAEREFLERSEWDKVWGFDARDYLPLFHYARMNRIPMLALNVERSLPEAIGKLGWDAVPEAQKVGVSRPAAPGAAYEKELRRVFDHHPVRPAGERSFAHFVEAQTVWDRAMAEVIAQHLQRQPDALVVGILGGGHVRHGHGVAHQLKDLGVARVGTLLTWNQTEDCTGIVKGLADAVYVVQEPPANPPRLGISMEPAMPGIRLSKVIEGSVAEQSGLKSGDVIIMAAGQPATSMGLRAVVQRQPAGTWLPLKIKRGDEEIEIMVRFPTAP
jgi:uncharacterized iron-regulated protein